MRETLTVPARFRGFAGSGNGGYACGAIARLIGGSVGGGALGGRVTEATLRRPVPLDRPLSVERPDAAHVRLLDDATLVAEGELASLALELPEPVTYEDAERASASYLWREGHPAPECFVCGPERAPGDGLRIFPGAVPGRDLVAAPWSPHASVTDEAGLAHEEIVWAALDCPSWFGSCTFEPELGVGVLGRLTGEVRRRPSSSERCVAIGWRTAAHEGRKVHVGSAVLDERGDAIAIARATWILTKGG